MQARCLFACALQLLLLVHKAFAEAELLESDAVSCDIRETNLGSAKGGRLNALDGHAVMCDEHSQLQGWVLKSEQGTGGRSQIKIQYKCCTVTPKPGICETLSTREESDQTGSLDTLQHHEPRCKGGKLLRGWELKTKIAGIVYLRYVCCSLAGTSTLDADHCETKTSAERPKSHDVKILKAHEISCHYGQALTDWRYVTRDTQAWMEYSCCGVKLAPAIGPKRTCVVVGALHVITFDGNKHETASTGAGETFWLVRSRFVEIQTYLQGTCPDCPALSRGLVIGGRFLKGYKLVLKKDVEALREGNAPASLLETTSPSGVDNVIEWDGSPVDFSNGVFKVRGVLSLTKQGNKVRADLPLGVQITVDFHSYYQDNFISMGEPPGGQDGQCGNNNGNAGDDGNLAGAFPLESQENMFLDPGLKEVHDLETVRSPIPQSMSLKDCEGSELERATRICNSKFPGDDFVQDFLSMCKWDVCFTEDGEHLAENIALSEQEVRAQLVFQKPQGYKIIGKKDPIAARTACPGAMKIVKISSAAEQSAVMASVVQAPDASEFVWIGGKRVQGVWTWHDGQVIVGFENWAEDAMTKHPDSPWMCMSRRSGLWMTCGETEFLSVICQDEKHFSSVSTQNPIEARLSCDSDHQLVMPKSSAQQTALMASLSLQALGSDAFWLGATYQSDRWVWDDGSEVTWTNWDDLQPNLAQANSRQLWMSADAQTGRWKVSAGNNDFNAVVCESRARVAQCDPGSYSPADLGLVMQPAASFSEFMGHCYYLGKGEESCDATCERQMGGVCNSEGLIRAAASLESCLSIVRGFGGIGMESDAQNVVGTEGCTYKDLGMVSDAPVAQVLLHTPFEGLPASCDAMTHSSKEHRICACESTQWRTYPEDHVLVEGEQIHLTGHGFPEASPFEIRLRGTLGPASRLHDHENITAELDVEDVWDLHGDGDGVQVPLKGEPLAGKPAYDAKADYGNRGGSITLVNWKFNPTTMHVLKEYLDYKAEKQSVSVAWWQFPASAGGPSPWHLAVTATRDHWQVLYNGRRYPELDIPRSAAHYIQDLEAPDIPDFRYALLPQPAAAMFVAMAAHSSNGCQDHPFGSDAARVVSFTFKIFPSKVDGVRCIRCEPRPVEQGNHIMLENGQIVLVLEGTQPRKQIFDWQITENRVYTVGISYVSSEMVAELYHGKQRVEVKRYVQASPAKIHPGHLGCAGSDEDRDFSGEVFDFKMTESIMERRPSWQSCVFFRCPTGKARKPDAALRSCTGSVCGHPQDADRCCADLGKCLKFTCSPEFVLRKEFEEITCAGAECTEMECCEHRAVCSSFTCPTGKVLKEGHSDIGCVGATCGDDDVETCCDELGKCIDYVCPEFHVHKPKAAQQYCADRDCRQTDYNLCCSQEGMCSTLQCPDGKVLRPNASRVPCPGLLCQVSRDAHLCCETMALCSSYICPGGLVHRANPEQLHCHDHTCSSDDNDICCQTAGHCMSVTCPDDFILRENAHEISCADLACSNFETCCTQRPTCADHICPPGSLHKAGYASMLCNGATCGAVDDTVCCDQLAPCSSAACPDGHTHLHNASETMCHKSVCDSSDIERCCVQEGLCSSMVCPPGHAHTSRAATTSCAGVTCDVEHDADVCCDPCATCDRMACPEWHVLVPDAHTKLCRTSHCGQQDFETCCAMQGTCSSMSCPEGHVRRDDAASVICSDSVCKDEDVPLCCEAKAQCTEAVCHQGEVRRHLPNLTCHAQKCTEKDRATCCVPQGNCQSFSCPFGMVHRPSAAKDICSGEVCVEGPADIHLCCERAEHCSMMECPETMILRPESDIKDRHCSGPSCTSADAETCCEDKPLCTAMTCPTGMLLKHNASKLHCSSPGCHDTPEQHCCALEGTCGSVQCGHATVHRDHPESIICPGPVCEATHCCQPVARCHTVDCEDVDDRLINKANGDLECSSASCNTEECCEEKGSCSSMVCLEGFVLRPSAAELRCAGATCQGDKDNEQCCEPQAE